jgi:mono/diheme cytochrome c family protein
MQNAAKSAMILAVLAIATNVYLFAQGGPTDRPRVDATAAGRGRLLYTQYCVNCHGLTAKGTDRGPDLIRSVIVLRDRLGNGLGPAIRKSATHQADLTEVQVTDLAHFLRQRIEAITQNRTPTAPLNVLTGNVEAGRAYFNGAGKCNGCHSPAGDLAGIARRIPNPVNLQQRFLFPSLTRGSGRQVEVTVTPPRGAAISGELVRMDDFNVSLRDASGEYRSIRRVEGMKVDVRDPLAVHHELLDQYTDADMHNIVAYLETLK